MPYLARIYGTYLALYCAVMVAYFWTTVYRYDRIRVSQIISLLQYGFAGFRVCIGHCVKKMG